MHAARFTGVALVESVPRERVIRRISGSVENIMTNEVFVEQLGQEFYQLEIFFYTFTKRAHFKDFSYFAVISHQTGVPGIENKHSRVCMEQLFSILL